MQTHSSDDNNLHTLWEKQRWRGFVTQQQGFDVVFLLALFVAA